MDYSAVIDSDANRQRLVTPVISAHPICYSEFRKGKNYENWRPQGAPNWLIIATICGGGRVILPDGKSHPISTSQLLLYEPGVQQDYATDPKVGNWHIRWAHFEPRPHWLPWLKWPVLGAGVHLLELRSQNESKVKSAFQKMILSKSAPHPYAEHLAMCALEEALIHTAVENQNESSANFDSRVDRAFQYIAMNFDRPFSMPELARHCMISESRLSHLFKKETGRTPREESEEQRLNHAHQLLKQTTLSIANIALEVGYTDPFYFSRRYKKRFGHAPSCTPNQ